MHDPGAPRPRWRLVPAGKTPCAGLKSPVRGTAMPARPPGGRAASGARFRPAGARATPQAAPAARRAGRARTKTAATISSRHARPRLRHTARARASHGCRLRGTSRCGAGCDPPTPRGSPCPRAGYVAPPGAARARARRHVPRCGGAPATSTGLSPWPTAPAISR